MRSPLSDGPLDEALPSFTASAALNMIVNAHWATDYPALIEAFWNRHEQTYCALAKLAFLHRLHTQVSQRKISREGYQLALDALGLRHFPDDWRYLEQPATGTLADASMLSLNGQQMPGAFQLRSHNTSHCFIHQPGSAAEPVEFISDDPGRMSQMLLNALNTAGGLACLHDPAEEEGAVTPELTAIEGDIFSAITRAQKLLSLRHLQTDNLSDNAPRDNIDLLKPIRHALELVSAIDLWPVRPGILRRIPVPLKTAGRLMRKMMKDEHGLDINPDHVFIRYRRGKTFTPLGSAHVPVIQVTVPDESPISLSQALVINYRVQRAEGYLDRDARTVVYVDHTGKGDGADIQELAVTAQAIENHIRQIDFLSLMTARIERFWDKHKNNVEQCFKTNFMTQAVLCFKKRLLFRSGFDIVVKALEQLDTKPRNGAVEWSVPGFYLQHSVVDGVQEVYCPSLLVLSVPGRPQKVLYQAGVVKGFIEFDSDEAIKQYIHKAARNMQWQESVLAYVPTRHHQRLTYILNIWGGKQRPSEPVSILRPWTDALYNHDAHKAAAHELCSKTLTTSPFQYMREALKQNGLWDAQDLIVTSSELLLRYWTRQLNHLQILLAPLSILITPALLATLAAEIGVLSLNIASAHLPGARHEEKRQVMLTALTLGLFQLAPYTPRLLHSFRRLIRPAKTLTKASAVVPNTRSFSSLLNRSMHQRHTRLEKFFGTDSLLKTWDIPGFADFGTLPVRAWKLARQFLLWTSGHDKARILVVSTHGYHLPWSKSTPIPNGTELSVYAPHGYELIDPALHRVVRQHAKPFALLNTQVNTPLIAPGSPAYVLTDKLMAGSYRPGMIKNYKLSKFQSPNHESYQDISHIVRNSNQSPLAGQFPAKPMDVLTVRNRFGMTDPTLEDLFKELFDRGIHYDKILLLHCRCSAFQSLIGTAPVFRGS